MCGAEIPLKMAISKIYIMESVLHSNLDSRFVTFRGNRGYSQTNHFIIIFIEFIGVTLVIKTTNKSFCIKQVLNSIAVFNSKALLQGQKTEKSLQLQGTESCYLQQSIAFHYGEQQICVASLLLAKALIPILTNIHFQGTLIPCLSCGGNKVMASV